MVSTCTTAALQPLRQLWDSKASYIFSAAAVITHPSLDVSFHGDSFPVANIFSGLGVGKVVAYKKSVVTPALVPIYGRLRIMGPL